MGAKLAKVLASIIIETIRKAETSNYANVDEFMRHLTKDEQIALAYLIRKAEDSGIAKDSLRSAFVKAFRKN